VTPSRPEEHDPEEKPVVRDRRRIDPVTGAVREPQPAAAPQAGTADPADLIPTPEGVPGAEAGVAGRVAELESMLAERTGDVQRLQAEYVNYKRRVDRDRAAVRDTALAGVLGALLPVLDDIARAREHGELDGGFKAVADSFERTLEALGLEQFGEPGDPFDPRIHEALMHGYSDDVSGPTCQAVLQAGFRLGERVIRPARVAVVDPAEPASQGPAGPDRDGAQPDAAEPYPDAAEPYAADDAPVEAFGPADSSVPEDADMPTPSEAS